MPRLEVVFKWDKKRCWFDIDVLELILYSSESIKRELLTVSEITQDTEQGDCCEEAS